MLTAVRVSPRLAGADGIGLFNSAPLKGVESTMYGLLAMASAGVSVYHGYKRNDSLGWGIAWGLLGGLFPVITPAVAFAQGLGQRK